MRGNRQQTTKQTNSEILESFLKRLDHSGGVLDFLVKNLGKSRRAGELHRRDVHGTGGRTWHNVSSCQLNLARNRSSKTRRSCRVEVYPMGPCIAIPRMATAARRGARRSIAAAMRTSLTKRPLLNQTSAATVEWPTSARQRRVDGASYRHLVHRAGCYRFRQALPRHSPRQRPLRRLQSSRQRLWLASPPSHRLRHHRLAWSSQHSHHRLPQSPRVPGPAAAHLMLTRLRLAHFSLRRFRRNRSHIQLL